jgi:hypothetical protein
MSLRPTARTGNTDRISRLINQPKSKFAIGKMSSGQFKRPDTYTASKGLSSFTEAANRSTVLTKAFIDDNDPNREWPAEPNQVNKQNDGA